jgi:hypothetical protein
MSAIGKGIEDPDFDRRMAVKRKDLLIAGNRVSIVDENAYVNSSVRGAEQRRGNEASGFIATKNEILQIDRAFRRIDHLYPGQESIDTDAQDAKTGVSAMIFGGLRKFRAEKGLLRVGERNRRLARTIGTGGLARAAAD